MSASRKLTTVKYSIAPFDQPFARRNSWSEYSSYSRTMWCQACGPSRATIARRSPTARSQSASAVSPRSWSSSTNGRRVGSRSASARVIRRAAEVDQCLRVAHHERPQRQPEQVAVAEREVVGARDAHARRPRRTGPARTGTGACRSGHRPGSGPPAASPGGPRASARRRPPGRPARPRRRPPAWGPGRGAPGRHPPSRGARGRPGS